MTKKDRTIAALQYIDSVELNKRQYLKHKLCTKKSTWFIYFSYQRLIEKFVLSFKLVDYMYNAYEMRSLIRSNTSCILPRSHRKLITLISFYYHQKNRKFLLPLIRAITERSKILFTK
jgi:hypothetical protein|nr:MAG TPA: hypothetical protein [Caudoviricetes sp.]